MKEDQETPAGEPYFDPTRVPNPEVWEQKRRLADAIRRVISQMVLADAPIHEISDAADALERFGDALADYPELRRVMAQAEGSHATDTAAFFDQSPLIGLANPIAPPITISRSGPLTATATVRFGSSYEGPPGHVHGGFVAAAFDEVLGYVQSLGGNPGMTGHLAVRYRKPTPLYSHLRFEARLSREQGRKIFTEAQLYAGSDVTAEAEGLFISIPRERLERLGDAAARSKEK